MKRGYFTKIILLLYFFHVSLSIQPVTDSEGVYLSELKEDDVGIDEQVGLINGSLFGTVKKFYCKVDIQQEPDLLLLGTKAWNFPSQDVSLTLAYPSQNLKYDRFSKLDYILTELQVVFFIDGDYSKGYITNGGMLQNNIRMTFVFKNITSLSYQFYLYGVPNYYNNNTENYLTFFPLC